MYTKRTWIFPPSQKILLSHCHSLRRPLRLLEKLLLAIKSRQAWCCTLMIIRNYDQRSKQTVIPGTPVHTSTLLLLLATTSEASKEGLLYLCLSLGASSQTPMLYDFRKTLKDIFETFKHIFIVQHGERQAGSTGNVLDCVLNGALGLWRRPKMTGEQRKTNALRERGDKKRQ